MYKVYYYIKHYSRKNPDFNKYLTIFTLSNISHTAYMQSIKLSKIKYKNKCDNYKLGLAKF